MHGCASHPVSFSSLKSLRPPLPAHPRALNFRRIASRVLRVLEESIRDPRNESAPVVGGYMTIWGLQRRSQPVPHCVEIHHADPTTVERYIPTPPGSPTPRAQTPHIRGHRQFDSSLPPLRPAGVSPPWGLPPRPDGLVGARRELNFRKSDCISRLLA